MRLRLTAIAQYAHNVLPNGRLAACGDRRSIHQRAYEMVVPTPPPCQPQTARHVPTRTVADRGRRVAAAASGDAADFVAGTQDCPDCCPAATSVGNLTARWQAPRPTNCRGEWEKSPRQAARAPTVRRAGRGAMTVPRNPQTVTSRRGALTSSRPGHAPCPDRHWIAYRPYRPVTGACRSRPPAPQRSAAARPDMTRRDAPAVADAGCRGWTAASEESIDLSTDRPQWLANPRGSGSSCGSLEARVWAADNAAAMCPDPSTFLSMKPI